MFGREQLSSQVEQLRTRLAESQQSLQSTTVELQQLQTEHDTLLERHNKILQETVSKEAELRERWAGLASGLVWNLPYYHFLTSGFWNPLYVFFVLSQKSDCFSLRHVKMLGKPYWTWQKVAKLLSFPVICHSCLFATKLTASKFLLGLPLTLSPSSGCYHCSRRTWLCGQTWHKFRLTFLPRLRPNVRPTGSSWGSCRTTTEPLWRPCRASWHVSRSSSSTCRARTVRVEAKRWWRVFIVLLNSRTIQQVTPVQTYSCRQEEWMNGITWKACQHWVLFSALFTSVRELLGERTMVEAGGVVGVFMSRAAVEAHSSPPTQLPCGVKQQIHT